MITQKSILIVGILFHLTYIWSIFDIYFKSPLIHGMKTVAPVSKPPADRLVFFVADGCRADKFFEENDTYSKVGREFYSKQMNHQPSNHSLNVKTKAPFLRSIIETKGSWGVSHTRVPTESRPGHVALFAGFYEDVSAVTKGWQENPVEFDSVFNRSYHSWLFGSPDIVPMFAKNVPHVEEYHYRNQDEDFSKDAYMLDIWVFQHVQDLLQRAASNSTLNDLLHHPRVVIFLHLLGIDSNGHAHRPYSEEYLANIALVDSGVEKIYHLMEEFYGHDGKTSYIFTADHGMSNKGAHGDGDPSNTRTPIVAWGAGIRGPEPHQPEPVENSEATITVSSNQVKAQWDEQSENEAKHWRLDGLRRKDIMQADVSPLMASLLGIAFPQNSVGVLPLAYLSPGKYRAECILGNSEQVFSQVRRKSYLKEASALFFRPYGRLNETEDLLQKAKYHLDNGNYETAEILSHQVIQFSMEGLAYFQMYDWLFLMVVITLGYCGWIGLLLLRVLLPKDRSMDLASIGVPVAIILTVVYTYLAIEQSSFTYFLYVLFPVVFGALLFSERKFIQEKLNNTRKKTLILVLVVVLLGLECITVGYHRRQVFSALFLALSGWPFIESQYQRLDKDKYVRNLSVAWAVSCWIMSIFPFLPSEYGDNLALVHLGAILSALALSYFTFSLPLKDVSKKIILGGQAATILVAAVIVHWIVYYLKNKMEVPMYLPMLSWIVSFASIPIPFFMGTDGTCRLVSIMGGLVPAYILLSISYEVLFYVAFCITLLLWWQLEVQFNTWNILDESRGNQFNVPAIRLSFFFLLFINIAFFGTGNVASISSFEISSTYRFVTVFSPFLMGALLIFKILIPFTLVTSVFSVLTMFLGNGPYSTFLIVLAMSDVLSINFFFLVQDEGSWKEIGNSISMFAIVNAQIIFIPLMFLISRALTHAVVIPKEHHL